MSRLSISRFSRLSAISVLFSLTMTAPVLAQDRQVTAFAKQLLREAQAISIPRNREYCGTIGLDEAGNLIASRLRRGQRLGCRPRDPEDAVEILATFHTHGGFSPRIDSEVPSSNDLISDFEEGTDGYIATPGGRFWYVDGQKGTARQICGIGCLPSDPNFIKGDAGHIPKSVSIADLIDREDS